MWPGALWCRCLLVDWNILDLAEIKLPGINMSEPTQVEKLEVSHLLTNVRLGCKKLAIPSTLGYFESLTVTKKKLYNFDSKCHC